MTILFGASQSGIGLIRDLQTGFLGRLLLSPARPAWILLGKVLADTTRLLVQAALVMVLATALGARLTPRFSELPAAMLAVALFALAYCSLSCAIALTTRTQESMAAFVHLVNMPLLFTSSVLVPAKQMPTWLEGISRFNPVTLAADAWRGAWLPIGPTATPGPLIALAIIAAALFALASLRMRAAARD